MTQLASAKNATGLSLLFAAGARPTARDLELLLADPGFDLPAAISHRPDDGPHGVPDWLEILASGMAFDVTGLAPGEPAASPSARHFFGLPDKADTFPFEAIRIAPGDHVAAGGSMIPLVRVMMALALGMAGLPGLRAVCWHPVSSWMDAGYFARVMRTWLAGGAFPALGLAAMIRGEDGEIESRGLRFFIGQELRVQARGGETDAETVKLAVRAADLLVRAGRLERAQELTGPGGEPLFAEPSADGRLAYLRRIA